MKYTTNLISGKGNHPNIREYPCPGMGPETRRPVGFASCLRRVFNHNGHKGFFHNGHNGFCGYKFFCQVFLLRRTMEPACGRRGVLHGACRAHCVPQKEKRSMGHCAHCEKNLCVHCGKKKGAAGAQVPPSPAKYRYHS